MKTGRRACFLFVLVLVLVSIYWNVKPSTSGSHSRTKLKEDLAVTVKVGKQALNHGEESITAQYIKLDKTTISPNPPEKYSLLRKRLFQLEAKLNESKLTSRVIFMGSSDILKAEISLFVASLQQHGYFIDKISGKESRITQWSGLFCYYRERRHGTQACLHGYTPLKLYQKISFIPGLVNVFSPPKSFCHTILQTQHISALSRSPLSVPCFTTPPKPKHKHNLSDKLLKFYKKGSVFAIQSKNNSITFTMKDPILNHRLRDNSILQVISQPFQVDGLPVIIIVYVILTSISPLRIYRHNDGRALIMTLDKGQIKETWTLQKFKLFLSKQSTVYDAQNIWNNIDAAIVHTLMISESLLSSNNLESSKNGFQLLEFHFTFNSSLYPFLIKVKPPEPGRTLPLVANDTVSILFAMTSSYSHVTNALTKLKDSIGVEGVNCNREQSVCLSTKELIYLLESHRENSAKRGFKKLYPTNDSLRYRTLLVELRSSSVGMVTSHNRGTPELHSALLQLENYGSQGTNHDTTKQHDSKRKEHWQTDDEDDSGDQNAVEDNQAHSDLNDCDDDRNTAPVLTDIFIKPEATINPTFDNEIMEYEVVFPFSVMMINLWGTTSTCWSAAAVNSKSKPSKEPVSYYLGVGWNEFIIFLLHLSNRPPAVVATYKINIYRQTRNERRKQFDSRSPHEVCTLKQDCDLKIFPEVPCGPKRLFQNSFNKFQLDRKRLPFCTNGYAPGSWVFPCENCSQQESCYWNEALWVPNLCKHRRLTAMEAKTCLVKKKILFVGDSTNRGMMYYLMQKINGSLHQWEKTHSMKVYSSALNDDQTSVSFAYFPQFWLPSYRKPDFLKALHHLMAKFMPLYNSADTILVVGGVQWLRPSHVTAIKSTLISLGLSGIKVIIKTLGSGFHLPVPGVVELDSEGQMKVSRRNELLIKTSVAAGFEVIDTHTMTITRYKEFLTGKCGCHFHKVVDLKSHSKEVVDILRDEQKNGHPRYHVLGSINSAYSDIMISRMCS